MSGNAFKSKKSDKNSPWPIICFVAICILSAIFLLRAAWTDSVTNDEIVHIPAGYDYVRYFTLHLNPEHPPLLKALAAAPLLLLHPTFPAATFSTSSPDLNELLTGEQFLYNSGNNADTIVRVARIAPIGITILTIIFIYLLSQFLMDSWWSLVPASLFAFDPTILGNGHLVTTDVAAAFGIVVATYYFLKNLKTRSRKSLWLAGLFFGIAQLLKFSTIVLIPFFFLIDLVWRMRDKKNREKLEKEDARDTIFIFLIGYALVYIVYSIFMVHYPASQQIADTIAALNERLGGISGLGSFTVWMAGVPLLRPFAEYRLRLRQSFARRRRVVFSRHIPAQGTDTHAHHYFHRRHYRSRAFYKKVYPAFRETRAIHMRGSRRSG
jgi:dolichyl-phosphate-mannose--protein O-mannosyl transferase